MTTPVKERPIVLAAWEVRAILDGRKTQTRQVMKPQPQESFSADYAADGSVLARRSYGWTWGLWPDGPLYPVDGESIAEACPFGKPGDRLWVRETWAANAFLNLKKPGELREEAIYHRATYPNDSHFMWRSSTQMPRWASRLTLEIESVRVERLQDLTQKEAEAEGADFEVVELQDGGPDFSQDAVWGEDYVSPFIETWDAVNAKRGHSWESNPFVWALTFKTLTTTGGPLDPS